MPTRYYTVGQFAALAGVTIRTLRYYDQVGLLHPSSVSEAGRRCYTDRDLLRLEQVLALKLLGFSLGEIRDLLLADPPSFPASLERQRQMMVQRREQVQEAIRAIEALQKTVSAGNEMDWPSVIRVIRATKMAQNKDWWKQYYPEDEVRRLEERASTYSAEQQQADQKAWEDLISEVKAAYAKGEDPAGSMAQELARRWVALIDSFTMGDSGIYAGLTKMWTEGDLPFPRPCTTEEEAFIHRAIGIYRDRGCGGCFC